MASLAVLQEVPPMNLILLIGLPGSGKSTFCHQAVLSNIQARPIIYVTTEAPPSKIVDSLSSMGLGDELPHALGFVDAFHTTVGLSTTGRPDTVNASSEDLTGLGIAISKMKERMNEKVLLVFDSLTTPYLMAGPEILRFMRMILLRSAAEGDAVLSCVDEGCGRPEDLNAMMTTANGIIRLELSDGSRLFKVLKHPEVSPTTVEMPAEPERVGLETRQFNPTALGEFVRAGFQGNEAFLRRELGDLVNLFWPNLAHWSGVLWDPKRFPVMTYEANKDDWPSMFRLSKKDEAIRQALLPRRTWLLVRLFMPKSLSKVRDMKRLGKFLSQLARMRVGIGEYLEGASGTDDHHFRIHESSDCWRLESTGTAIASFVPPMLAGFCKGLECWKGLERDWNAVETKCIGLGDPHCEIRLIPGEIDGLRESLEKDVPTMERIHDRLMRGLMGYLLEGKPLVEGRERLGSEIDIHAAWHAMGGEGIPAMGMAWSERYRMALRMGGTRTGKMVGEGLAHAGMRENEAIERVLGLLEHCKVGRVSMDGTIRMRESCESLWTSMYKKEFYSWKEPCCFFTTGFLNGFFSAVKNEHVKEAKCIGIGDPYCEWEFR